MLRLMILWFLAFFTLCSYSLNAAISLKYDNDTGEFEMEGSDAGPGTASSGSYFLWDFANTTEANDLSAIINSIVSFGMTGTLDSQAIVTAFGTTNGSQAGFFVLNPMADGTLDFPKQSGTASTGLWSSGDNTFIATPSAGLGPMTDNFTLTVGAIPEPGTYTVLLGLGALGLVVWRKRKA